MWLLWQFSDDLSLLQLDRRLLIAISSKVYLSDIEANRLGTELSLAGDRYLRQYLLDGASTFCFFSASHSIKYVNCLRTRYIEIEVKL